MNFTNGTHRSKDNTFPPHLKIAQKGEIREISVTLADLSLIKDIVYGKTYIILNFIIFIYICIHFTYTLVVFTFVVSIGHISYS